MARWSSTHGAERYSLWEILLRGGHPSSSPTNIQSGRGWVHNTFMLEGIEKMVLRAPAKAFQLLPWFPGHRTQDVLGRRLTDFEYEPSWLKIPGIAVAGVGA